MAESRAEKTGSSGKGDLETRALKPKRGKWGELGQILVLAAVMIGVYALMQQWAVRDWWAGLWYQPSEAASRVVEDLELTGVGRRILMATRPLIESGEEFDEHCGNYTTEVSLLGCYTGGRIYVYEVTMPELADSNKVTMVHELLHAAWARMGEREREEVAKLLRRVQRDNAEWFEEELSAYPEEERLEEVYTRAATKLRELPEELEEHYAKYLQDRRKIVEYYEAYQAPFKRLQEENDALKERIFAAKEEIETEREEYLRQAAQLEGEVEAFNACAEATGCFQSEAEFQRKRNELALRQEELDAMRERLNAKITENNARVEAYQENRRALGELNNAIGSKVEEV